MADREYILPNNRGNVVVVDSVLKHIYQHVQKHRWNKEAGGQLFSPAPEEHTIKITDVTGPYSQDRRTLFSFAPNKQLSINDRKKHFGIGNHAVGIWHTHPQADPMPSTKDQRTTKDYLKACDGILEGFLLAILGNKGSPLNITLWLALYDKGNIDWLKLEENTAK